MSYTVRTNEGGEYRRNRGDSLLIHPVNQCSNQIYPGSGTARWWKTKANGRWACEQRRNCSFKLYGNHKWSAVTGSSQPKHRKDWTYKLFRFMSDLVTLSRKDCLRTIIGAKGLHTNVLCSDCCFVSNYRCIVRCCFLMFCFLCKERRLMYSHCFGR